MPAVARLAELGILRGFDDGTLRGDEPVSRYHLAMVLDRVLDRLDPGDSA
ncbi:MAG: S-layer homology domain-containing protein [Thermaerobacterales bacterium]